MAEVIHLASDYGTWACGPGKPGDTASFDWTDTTCSDCIASGSGWVATPYTEKKPDE